MSLPKADEWTDPGSMDPVPRRGRTCLIALAIGLLAVLGSILIWRATSLLGLPDIGEPFDLKAHGTVPILDEDNAFTYYREAVAKLTGGPSVYWRPHDLNWAQIHEQDRNWYLSNRDAIGVWLMGTTKDQAVFIQPRDQTCDATSLDPVQKLRNMIRIVQIAGLHMESQGKLEDAWILYRAALRSSRHCGKNGSFIERLVGMSLYSSMTDYVRSWAEKPNLNRDSLEKALGDVLAIDALTPTLRENYEAEFFAFARLLDDPDLTRGMVQAVMDGKTRDTLPNLQERLVETLRQIARREPERSRRAIRLVWANWLSIANLPESERTRRRHEFPLGILYDPPADAPDSARRLSPESLNQWVESTRLLRLILPATPAFEKAEARERATRAALIVHLAGSLYQRDQGKPPDSAAQLVGPYLKALPEGYEPASPQP